MGGGRAAPTPRPVARLRTPPKPADPLPADANKKPPGCSLVPGEAVAFAEPAPEPPSGCGIRRQAHPSGQDAGQRSCPAARPGAAVPPSAEQPK